LSSKESLETLTLASWPERLYEFKSTCPQILPRASHYRLSHGYVMKLMITVEREKRNESEITAKLVGTKRRGETTSEAHKRARKQSDDEDICEPSGAPALPENVEHEVALSAPVRGPPLTFTAAFHVQAVQ